MEVNNVKLEHVCGNASQFPDTNLNEIAFAGKSNVGKSSLINALVNRKSLARTSAQPGKTQTINFYNVEGKLYFVDLPGYGYAKVSAQERERWGKFIESYLVNRKQLKQVVLLIDIRHKPGENDKLMYEWLRYYQSNILVVATKADKIKRSQYQKHLSIIRKELGMDSSDILIPFSSVTKQGKKEIWDLFEQWLLIEE
ncbi:MAG TPA: ribosome biogenesis GTP-binding protein YihA/YsxC [Defluviitaleaceae bacterium]|jgi:GTP-binding protein|nr:YihA family ribosome biogenesis GTP-binding protein [Candidatus Epulonipiscium sp.]HOQ16935.1 ribosome biogenesis GTP-binding protein YihA/YsxC [Defluviitaleaceae bacterium]HPT76831.1 ribosome biogenesis GTP-binding protein YihA/YsxC [Defluviitaleaceae bacterium]HQD49773.1 ribosome biogenesis GTP-binding protein YihA/YsxC [Defluviitaleaceae bacterium]